MVAITWLESNLGLQKINLGDVSCGNQHILLSSLIHRTGIKDNSWNRSRLCERLIADDDFSLTAALAEMKYWQNYWTSKGVSKVWSHAVASYNGGFNINITTNKYLKAIKYKIRLLKQMNIDE